MRTTNVAWYALRLGFGQSSTQLSTPVHSSAAQVYRQGAPDRVITRSATMLAVFGIALSSFSLKQMLASNSNKSMRKF